jgi:hypothetical protein
LASLSRARSTTGGEEEEAEDVPSTPALLIASLTRDERGLGPSPPPPPLPSRASRRRQRAVETRERPPASGDDREKASAKAGAEAATAKKKKKKRGRAAPRKRGSKRALCRWWRWPWRSDRRTEAVALRPHAGRRPVRAGAAVGCLVLRRRRRGGRGLRRILLLAGAERKRQALMERGLPRQKGSAAEEYTPSSSQCRRYLSTNPRHCH